MRKILLTLMASLLSCSGAYAFWPEATDSSLEIGVGYRKDKLEWKTEADLLGSYSGSSSSTDSGVPFGVSSHLKWKDLKIWQIEARGEYVTCDNIYLRASADYGWVHSGKNTDADFFDFGGTGSEVEFSRTHAHTKGHVYDVDFAVGYQFKMCDESFSLTPVIGYSWKGQHLRDRHLTFDSSVTGDFTLPGPVAAYYSDYYYTDYTDYTYTDYYSYDSLNSRYHTRWNGPFIGLDLDYRFCCEWSLFLDYEFHWATYHAKARWNLRDDLPEGFHHRSKRAFGHVVDFGVKWAFCDCWTLALKGKYQYFYAKHGRDRALIADESIGDIHEKCYVSIPLRDVRWHSAAISLDLGMAF